MVTLALPVPEARALFGWFGSGEKAAEEKAPPASGPVVERKVLDMSKDQNARFIELIAQRHALKAGYEVLEKLRVEKSAAARAIEAEMLAKYGLAPEDQVHFVSESRSIRWKTVKAASSPPDAAPKEYRFSSTADLDTFRARLTLMLELRRQARTLQELVREHESGIESINARLLADFGVDPLKSYRYEKDSRSIFEVPVSSLPTRSP